jgi:undecaprenyl diphosphate synthase
MIDLKKIPEIIQTRIKATSKNIPKHVLLNTATEINNPEEKEKIIKKKIMNFFEIIKTQIEINLPILTISLGEKKDLYNEKILFEFFDNDLKTFLIDNKIRTSFFGKWYSLPGMIVEVIKKIVNETRDYDKFFLNICINYDGQEEIVDSCRLILKKFYDNKLDPDIIKKNIIKENIYSSYFIPPELIIETTNNFSGTFLWDSKGSKIFFLNKKFENFSKSDFQRALDFYKKDN